MPIRIIAISFIFLSLFSFAYTVKVTGQNIGPSMAGEFVSPDGVVGMLRTADLAHFTMKDYLVDALLPAFSGLIFVLLGISLSLFLPSASSRVASMLFHFLFGNTLILFAEFYVTRSLAYLFLFFLLTLPAAAVHFALAFSGETIGSGRRWVKCSAPYILSGILFVSCVMLFSRRSAVGAIPEYLIFLYLAAAFLLWTLRAAHRLRDPTSAFTRLVSRYELAGLVLGIWAPLGVAVAVQTGGWSLPIPFVLAFTLILPISLLAGVIRARLQQSRFQLVQSEKMATLGNLLAGLAHEINNPLTFVYSNMELLRDSLQRIKTLLPDPERKAEGEFADLDRMVDTMEEGATRAKNIIDHFRYFSYQGRQKLEEMDLNKILEQSIELLAPKWKSRLRIVRKFGNPAKILGYPGEIGQVFVNILANACEATPKRGTVRVRTLPDPSGVSVFIRDAGVGIPKDKLPRIFDPFFTTKEQGEGTGLGLAIAQQIIQKHQGKIEVKSEVGKGTEFVIMLPTHPALTARELEDEQESGIPQRRLI